MSKKPTQKEMVLEHLKQFGTLNPFIAFQEYGILTNLRTRVVELRKEGYNIETRWLKGVSKITGRQWRVANYVYHEA